MNKKGTGSGTYMEIQSAVRHVVAGSNQFGLQLYNSLVRDEKNLVFSPLGIALQMALLFPGATSEVRTHMREALNLTIPLTDSHRGFMDLLNLLSTTGPASSDASSGQTLVERSSLRGFLALPSELRKSMSMFGTGREWRESPTQKTASGDRLVVANRLWVQKNETYEETFFENLTNQFGDVIEKIDFRESPGEARDRINEWISRQTGGRIRDIVADDELSTSIRMFLTGTVALRSNWTKKFNKRFTRTNPFTLISGEQVNVPLMLQTSFFLYGETEEFQVLKLGYGMVDLSLVIVLPRTADGFRNLESKLNPETLAQWIGLCRPQKVRALVPKFSTTSAFSLAEPFSGVGLGDVFKPSAMENIAPNITLSAMLNKSNLAVDEDGTDAVTESARFEVMGIPPTTAQEFHFRADRPFIFAVTDSVTGSIVFLGRILNPVSE